MGIGDWGLGIGDWGLGIGPNPQSPFQVFIILYIFKHKIILINYFMINVFYLKFIYFIYK